jgi:hypothetical protein
MIEGISKMSFGPISALGARIDLEPKSYFGDALREPSFKLGSVAITDVKLDAFSGTARRSQTGWSFRHRRI